MLMGKRYAKLASYYVQLDPEHPKSEDEIIALIRRRLQRFEPDELGFAGQGRLKRQVRRANKRWCYTCWNPSTRPLRCP